jgi:hypothetical protein
MTKLFDEKERLRLSQTNSAHLAEERNDHPVYDDVMDLQKRQSVDGRNVERRLHQRFKTKQGAMALLRSKDTHLGDIRGMSLGQIGMAVLKSKPDRIGQIKDISTDGLCLVYVDDPLHPTIPVRLDILMAECGVSLRNLKIRTISDVDTINHSPYAPLKTRQLALQFVGLSQRQRLKLIEFIRNHTLMDGEA